MIYLIDDKKQRQIEDFGWTDEKFQPFKDSIKTIYSIDHLRTLTSKILIENNVVIYHESFLDNTQFKGEVDEMRREFENFAAEHPNFYLAIFGGSKNSRTLENNIAHLPVAIVYDNLVELSRMSSNGEIDLKFLLYGKNADLERNLGLKREEAIRDMDKPKPLESFGKSDLIVRTNAANGAIHTALKGAVIVEMFNKVSDADLSKKIMSWLRADKYDNIFLPLCFGRVLSDFNGLRLATHIRCEETQNQLSNIFLYGFVDMEYLYEDEYFNILKTKNVRLIKYSKSAIQEARNLNLESFGINELPKQISKLKLEHPKNYDDSHSVINERAIYRWTYSIGIEKNDELQKVFENVKTNLYFKYLRTIEPNSEITIIPKHQLEINSHRDARVLLIDDESSKGWGEIFAHLLDDINDLWSDSIGHDFHSLSREEIIEKSLQKIKSENIDLVILDFRLNRRNAETTPQLKATSLQLLKEIKKLNKGIQVIIFSATNKVWNLQDLQGGGADGFVFKDYGRNISQTIVNMICKVKECLNDAIFLKPIYKQTQRCISLIETQKKHKFLQPNVASSLIKYLNLGFDSMLFNYSLNKYDSAFVYYFLILEILFKELIDVDNAILIAEKTHYKFSFIHSQNFLMKFNEETGLKTKRELKVAKKGLYPKPTTKQMLFNLLDLSEASAIDPCSLVQLRNDFLHSNYSESNKIVAIEQDDVQKLFATCVNIIMIINPETLCGSSLINNNK